MSGAPESESVRDRRERAERLFEEARSLEPAGRAAHIAEACHGDEDLRQELQSLLTHAEAAERFFGLLGQVVSTPDLTGSLVAGRYEMGACIGVGGMGEVYRARDRLLERDVALKFLAPRPGPESGGQERLLKEARAAAALEHTNVCTVHEVGETADGRLFISMAYYDGETLKDRLRAGPLAVSEAVAIARQIARGLGAAHAQGIVHRDVKPGNVMLLRDGTVKLLDFGLAGSSDATLTRPGTAPGTVAYMSPEQVRGDAVDARSDLFSLGVILYEMLAGTNPFRRGADQAVLQAILHDEPEPVRERRAAASSSLQRIVMQLLQKRPDRRYGQVDLLSADLDRIVARQSDSSAPSLGLPGRTRTLPIAVAVLILLSAGAAILMSREPAVSPASHLIAADAAGSKTIAVLPFDNVNNDPEQDYLVDGLTEELIGALSRVRSLRVVARTSAFRFRGATHDIREIGHALNARVIVEGSVQRVGDSIRVRARLIDVEDGLHLWSDTYDRGLTDILGLQRDLALRIASELETELSPAERERVGRSSTASEEAYAHYLKGRYLWNRRTPAAFSRAIEHFQRAIEIDTGFAAAYAGLAAVYSAQGLWGVLGPAEAGAQVRATALEAVELDDGSAEAHAVLGVYHHAYGWNSEAAEREQLRAIELNPTYTLARYFYGNLLRSNGRMEEAVAQYRVAAALDPLDPNTALALSTALLLAGRFPEALESVSNALELDSMSWRAHTTLAEYHEFTGNHQEALRLFERALELQGGPSYRARVDYPRALAQVGREAEALQRLSELRAEAQRTGLHDPHLATLFLALDDLEGAIAWLEQGYRERHPLLRFIGGFAIFEPFEDDPRYLDLLRRVGVRR